jgi:hypothetical protein
MEAKSTVTVFDIKLALPPSILALGEFPQPMRVKADRTAAAEHSGRCGIAFSV